MEGVDIGEACTTHGEDEKYIQKQRMRRKSIWEGNI